MDCNYRLCRFFYYVCARVALRRTRSTILNLTNLGIMYEILPSSLLTFRPDSIEFDSLKNPRYSTFVKEIRDRRRTR